MDFGQKSTFTKCSFPMELKLYKIEFLFKLTIIQLDGFTSIFTKKFMIWLISRVRHYLALPLRSPADNRGFFYQYIFVKIVSWVLKYHRFSLGSFHVIKQEFTSSRIFAPWSALQGAELIKITILFTFLIHLWNIHMLSSICSILFEKPCENTKTRSPKSRASCFQIRILLKNYTFIKNMHKI